MGMASNVHLTSLLLQLWRLTPGWVPKEEYLRITGAGYTRCNSYHSTNSIKSLKENHRQGDSTKNKTENCKAVFCEMEREMCCDWLAILADLSYYCSVCASHTCRYNAWLGTITWDANVIHIYNQGCVVSICVYQHSGFCQSILSDIIIIIIIIIIILTSVIINVS